MKESANQEKRQKKNENSIALRTEKKRLPIKIARELA